MHECEEGSDCFDKYYDHYDTKVCPMTKWNMNIIPDTAMFMTISNCIIELYQQLMIKLVLKRHYFKTRKPKYTFKQR